ncbi:MAG: leucine-rich repeat protein [Thermoguttaceae bacterium]|nr:leucine-rich repeat protein [Thermoguttaceae bacterium]
MKEKQKCLGKVKLGDMIAGLQEAYELVDREDYEGAINLLADKYRIGPNTKNPKGRNPLFLVLEYYDGAMVKGRKIFRFIEALLEAGADVNCRDKYQLNLLHFAALRRCPEICQFLLDKGADPDVLAQDDHSPLDYSVKYYINECFPECLSVLLRGGADPCLPHDRSSSYVGSWEKFFPEGFNPEEDEVERLKRAYCRAREQLRIEKGEKQAFPEVYEAKDGMLYADGGKKLIRLLRNYPSNEVVIPESVEVIAEGAFSCCFSITSVVIPESVTSIEPFAFHFCTSLKSITIPKGIITLNNGSFAGCWDLETVALPENLKKIENGVFICCPSLKNVILPKSVTLMNEAAFFLCPSLTLTAPKDSYAEEYVKRVAKNYGIPYQLY